MNSKRILSLLAVLAILPLASCSGVKSSGGGGGGGGGGTGTGKVTLTIFDTPPSGVTLLSFTMPIVGISITNSSGASTNIYTPQFSVPVELTRLQTDSTLVFDGVLLDAGTYTSLGVTVGPLNGVFVNNSGSTITSSAGSCANGKVCNLPGGAAATIKVPITLTLSSGGTQWIGLNVNLNNAILTTGGITVDFTQPNVMTATQTVRTGIPSGSTDTIEDFVGTVEAYTSGSSIEVQSTSTNQIITATLTSSTQYDTPTAYSGCSAAPSCIKVGSIVSMDANLAANGSLTATEVDVLNAGTNVTEFEGVIYPTTTTGVIGMISHNGALIGNSTTVTFGTPITLNIAGANNFAIDTKTLSNQFIPTGFTNSADLLAGQEVRVQVSTFTSTTPPISASVSSILLRFSRMSGTISSVAGTSFNFTPPSYITTFNSGLLPSPLAYTYTGTAFDGVTGTTDANFKVGATAAIRTLFVNSAQPQFAVSKVRIP